MLSRWLRACLALAVAGLVAIAAWLVRGEGWGPGAAAAAVLAGLLAATILKTVITYALARSVGMRTGSGRTRGARRPAWRGAAAEWASAWTMYLVIMPFERLWMRAEAVAPGATGRIPVLLVHGYLCNRGVWWWMRRRLCRDGFPVATIDLEPPFDDIDAFADQLHARIEALIAETGAERIALVAHSMGGLVCRAYLRRYGAQRVERLITLASPHHGTWMARLGLGKNARQMELESAWIRELSAGEPLPVSAASIWSLDDELIVPTESSHLHGAREKVLSGVGHLALVASRTVFDEVQTELEAAQRLWRGQ